MINKTVFSCSFKKILIAILIFSLFLSLSYLIISSKYNFTIGDEGIFAFKTKMLYEKHKIDLNYATVLPIGQFFWGLICCLISGFSLKTLHISTYFATFFCMISFFFLLLQIELDWDLALIGALCLFINPLALIFIDWYMTESYFLFYFFTAMNLFVAGFKSGKARYFHLGSIFSIISIFTRQIGLSLPLALIVLLFFERKQLKDNFLHIFLSGIIPLLSLALFYLATKSFGDTLQLFTPRSIHLKKMINPLYSFLILLKDALHTLHYSSLYALPLILILLVAILTKKQYFKKVMLSKPLALLFSFSFMLFGTLILFFKQQRLMPYLPSIFGIGALTKLFGIKVIEKQTASVLLTIFTTFGGTIILYKILENLNWNKLKNFFLGRDKTKGLESACYLIYITGLFSFLINSGTLLIYDRYIFPVAVLVIFFILLKCSWIKHLKKTALIIFLIIYSIFIFKLKKNRMSHEIIWDATDLIMERGVRPVEINAGCGFGKYHNYYELYDIYKNVKIKCQINWHKFHPFANYFVLNGRKKHPGLELIDTLTNKSRFNNFKYRAYIFKRKANYKKPIWVR